MEQRHVRTRYLPTGEPELITRVRDEGTKVTRWLQYDSHGRMVVNVEPNTTDNYIEWGTIDLRTTIGATKPWRYIYNALGELLGTSDARGCGQNFHYDQVGRLVAEDYSPCDLTHADYTPIPPNTDLSSPDTAIGAEVYYLYDQQTASAALPDNCSSSYLKGRNVAVFDRASATKSVYDARGRVTQSCVRVAKPDDTNNPIATRYASRTYKKSVTYDSADREVSATTGLESGPTLAADLLGNDAQSRITTQYTARGTVKSVGGSYGSLIDNIQRTADGLMLQMRYGDAADTRTAYSYDQRRRVSSVQTYRGPPTSGGSWAGPYDSEPPPGGSEPSSFQLLLQDESFTYDIVGNPVEVHDWRDPAEWPDGAKPVSKKIQYDDLYRATRVDYQYTDGDDEWTPPFHFENEGGSDPRRAKPAPHQNFDKRIVQQTFQYDWLGNSDHTDDDAHGFYDRSLGDIENESDKPYQLDTAAQTGGSHSGDLDADYDAAGNLTRLEVSRNGECLGADNCDQVFEYEWDEVGRLSRARRFDFDESTSTLAADLRHYYDASDQRVIKQATVGEGESAASRYALYLFDTLELRGARFGFAGDGEYEYSEDTVVPYLLANGVRLARVMWEIEELPELPAVSAGKVHVFFELGDHLGSTSVVLDQATGELVERATFQAYGGAESDYRPARWAGFREDYRFTGKEEDVEVGLQYFGKRFLNPLLGRWVSADPLAVHRPGSGDLNVYAYVNGGVLILVDPVGLDGELIKALWDSAWQGNWGAGSPIAKELLRGDYPALQSDEALKSAQVDVVIGTLGTIAGLATGGLATAAGAGIVWSSVAGGVVGGAQIRMLQVAKAGGSPKEQVVAAVEPRAAATDAALGAAGGAVVKVAAPVLARAAARSVKPPAAPTLAELEALEVEATQALKGPSVVGRTLKPGEMYQAHVEGKAGLLAEVDDGDMLNLYIKVGPSTPRGGEMFNEAMAVAGDIKGIRGNWMNSADLGDNFNAYKAARGKGYSPEDAALNHTFTGHMAKKQGFTKVNVAVDTDEKVVVEFTRE